MVARAVTKKITDLPEFDLEPAEEAIFPMSKDGVTQKTKLSTLRQAMFYGAAFATSAIGLTYTPDSHAFHVINDSLGLTVKEYINDGGIAVPVTDASGNEIIMPSYDGFRSVATLFGEQGYSLLGEVDSFDRLREIKPSSDGVKIKLAGYTSGSNFGGGEFIGRYGTTAVDDGGVCAVGNGFYWSRVISGDTYTPSMFGATGDGSTLDDLGFGRLLSFASSTLSNVGIHIDGEGKTYKLTETLNVDVGKYSIRNMRLDYSGTAVGSLAQPKYAIIWDATPTTYAELDRRNNVCRDIEIIGVGYRTASNIHAMKFAPTNSLANLVLDNFYIRDFNSAYVFGSNAYLITFNNIRAHRCFHGILSTVDTQEVTSLSNCGENIRFNDCLFDSLHKVAYLSLGGWEFRFNDCSFDFTGRTPTEGYVQFYLGSGGCLFNFTQCHFESGNANAGWYSYGFHTTGAANVNIIGGTIRLVSATYNQCPYFFYDTSGLATFSIVDTAINGWGVQQWANTGLSSFRPKLKAGNSQFTLMTTNDPIVSNLNYVVGLDAQAVTLDSGVYTNRWTNDRVSIATSTVTKTDGTVIPTLLITKIAGAQQFCAVDVFFKRPVKAPHNSSLHGNTLFVAGPNQTSDRTITAITGSCTKGQINSVGVVTSMRTTTTTSVTLTLSGSSTAWGNINTSWGCSHSNSYLEFEYDRVRLDLSGMAAGDAIHLFNLAWYGAF